MATFPERRSFFKFPPRRNDFPPAGGQAVLETGRDGSGGKTDVNRTGYPRPGTSAPGLITCPPRLIFLATPIAWGADAPGRPDCAPRSDGRRQQEGRQQPAVRFTASTTTTVSNEITVVIPAGAVSIPIAVHRELFSVAKTPDA